MSEVKVGEKLQKLKQQLVEQGTSDDWLEGEGVWEDEDEIGELVRQAFERGMESDMVIACAQACRSGEGFKHHLSGMMGARKQRILLIDDEESFLDLLKVNIECTGKYEVQTESNALEALGRVEDFKPDLCVLDVIMPDKDGFELLGEIREQSHLNTVPVIMLTALLRDTEVDAVTRENTLFLSKPIDTKKLIYCIDEHLRGEATQP